MDTEKAKEKVLMTFVLYATFARRDVEILQKKYQVDLYHFNTQKKWFLPFAFVKQFFFLLFNTRRYKAIITQSSGYLSFWPAIFCKIYNVPLVIIAIGTDCARLPEINYGSHSKSIIAWFTRFSFERAKLILPVHKSLEKSFYSYADVQYPNQGIRSFSPKIKTQIIEMVNGYDTHKWKLIEEIRPDNTFLSVTFAIDEVGFYRKGIDLILAVARLFPHYEFTIVGKVFLKEACPRNVTLINNVSQEELKKIYNAHKYYIQLSMFEGFPNALCEAMLCGCIPIGSDVAGIPDIIGNAGYLLKRKHENELKTVFNELKDNTHKPKGARNQIEKNFPLERRESEFLDHIEKIK